MVLSTAIKTSFFVMGLSLAGCVEPTSTASPSQNEVVADASEAIAIDQATSVNNPVITTDFAGGTFSWSTSGGVIYRFVAIERDGEVFVCGAFTGRGSSNSRRLSREVMRQASMSVNGETIRQNLRFFTETSNANFSTLLVGVETSCASTGRAAGTVPLSAVRVDIRNGNYRVRL